MRNTISYNTLHSGPHMAIYGGGNDHIFQYNTISNFCYETADAGAFYSGRSFSYQGNEVRYNVFDSIYPIDKVTSGYVMAIYLDDQMSGISIAMLL